jgi:hypothetical protein
MPPQEKFGSKPAEEPAQESRPTASRSLEPSADERPKRKDDASKDRDVDFDELLPHVGEFGTYQKILFCLMIPFAFYVAWVYFSQIFITLVPEEHWCKVPELMDLPVHRRFVTFINSWPSRLADEAWTNAELGLGAVLPLPPRQTMIFIHDLDKISVGDAKAAGAKYHVLQLLTFVRSIANA